MLQRRYLDVAETIDIKTDAIYAYHVPLAPDDDTSASSRTVVQPFAPETSKI